MMEEKDYKLTALLCIWNLKVYNKSIVTSKMWILQQQLDLFFSLRITGGVDEKDIRYQIKHPII